MSDKMADKVALITGGSRGVGKAVSLALAREGVGLLFINYLENEKAMAALRTLIEPTGIRVVALPYNVLHPEEIVKMAGVIASHTDRLDYLVHCPALTSFKPLHKVRANHWDLTMNVSARSFLLTVQACMPMFVQGSSVVAVSSTGSQRYNPDYGALGVAKSALESTVRYLAVELATRDIRVNGVIAGMLSGESTPPFPNIEKVIEETLKRTPSGRLGTPEDVADAVLFLLTRGKWIVGQHIIVDGGYCLT